MSGHVILTGGTGFVGSHLLERLLKLDKKVILLKRSFSGTWRIDKFMENENLTVKNTDGQSPDDIFSQYDIEGIIHLASVSKRQISPQVISEMIDANIKFPTQLLEASAKNNVGFFVNTGSAYEYQLNNPPISEKTKIQPFNLYASTKIAFEDMLKFYSTEYPLKASTLKLFTPYGPKDNESKILPYLIVNSIRKDKIHIKSPEKTLDLTYITDVVDSYITLINNFEKLDRYESFNVGTGTGTRIRDVLKLIEADLGKNENVSFGDLEDDQVWCLNDKIKQRLNWTPETSLTDGIRLTIDYYKKIYGHNP